MQTPENAGSQAFGWPGIEPRWTSSTKQGVGTAYSSSSRVWFTISHGILNEIYYPTIDRPQVRDLGLLITDGATFCHEEKRDLEMEVSCVLSGGLSYDVSGQDPDERYRLDKQILCDPHEPCVLMRVSLQPAEGWEDRLRVYALLSPRLGGQGRGNSACRHVTAGRQAILAWNDMT